MISKINLDIGIKVKLISLLLIVIFFIINWNALNSFFSQDDFFHLRTIMDKSFFELTNYFLGGQKENTFYRPISRETFNFVVYKIFGLNSLIFHLISAGVIIFNGYLIYQLLKFFKFSETVRVLTLVVYFINPVHNVELYYLASIQNLLSTSFLLLGLINYQNFLIRSKRINYFLTIIFFILGLMSHESALVFIPIIIVLELISQKKIDLKSIRKIFLNTLPLLLIFGIRILLHFQSIGLDKNLSYQPIFSVGSILNTFSWFTLWVIGLPEMLVDFMTLKLNFNPNFFKWYSDYAVVAFPTILMVIFALIILTITLLKKIISDKYFLFFVMAYFCSLSPFLFFPHHKFIYYLSLPLVFFSGILGIILANAWNLKKIHRLLIFLLLTGYTISAYQTININQITYWAAKRANAAEVIISEVKSKFPEIKGIKTFYIMDDPKYPMISPEWGSSSKQAFYILSGSDAFKLLYKDPEIKVYFEDIDNKDGKLRLDQVNILQPEFPY